uniref:AVRA6 n=1 Tax=Blumeria hordei TaxID=2867405 RepID=UPI002740312C|nr:Chain A, AVRA6 [Blumeria hordei]8OXH_B Chain B, AVRA6 [Blumeria hordei]
AANLYYKCDVGDSVNLEEVLNMDCDAALTENRDEHPRIPTGESHKSYFFTKRACRDRLGLACYLLQVYGYPKKYQFSQYSNMEWKVCSLQDIR